MLKATAPGEQPFSLRALGKLIGAEWAAGIFGLRLFIGCLAIASFMMASVWVLGGGLSTMLARGGTTFLGGDVAVTTNVPLPATVETRLSALGPLSQVAEFRSSGRIGKARAAIEVKAVDDTYPLYGAVALQSGRDFRAVLADDRPHPPAIVEPALLARTGAAVGDVLRIGNVDFVIADVLRLEPDRLSAGRFMVGPRVLVQREAITASRLLERGAIVEFRTRLRADTRPAEQLVTEVAALQPETGWEFETPKDAGDRVLRAVKRTTTFLGIAGIVALTIGLSGAWAAARAWIQRRSRTIALYRLSGATPGLVLALHGAILLMASAGGLAIGLGAGLGVALPTLEVITQRLHVTLSLGDVMVQIAMVSLILVIGLAGCGLLALSSAARVSPGAAMRSGDAPLQADPRHVVIASAFLLAAVGTAAYSLPVAELAGLTTLGFVLAMGLLALAAAALSRRIARITPRSFLATVICLGLKNPASTAARTVAIGVGIIGITAIVAAQSSLDQALTGELPERVPDLVLIDVQPTQVKALRTRIETDPALGGLQAHPFMRMTITAINGTPAGDALVRQDKSWVIEGDRSFSWAAAAPGAELLQGEWWPEDYAGPPLVSPEEDMMEAFDLKVGDTVTYSVLGRSFTSTVTSIRKEYHRTFRPEYLMIASPQPFRNAPHTWIMSLQGDTDAAIDGLIRALAETHANVTSIDVRPIVRQVRGVIEGATIVSVAIAVLLVVAGALSVAALAAADVDSRRREALAFTLVGASRREIAVIRLAEAASIGAIAAILGGLSGVIGGYFIVSAGLRIAWAPNLATFLIPVALGIAAAVVAGIVGGLGAVPRGRGQMVRQLTS